jgi:hypothetical protein
MSKGFSSIEASRITNYTLQPFTEVSLEMKPRQH